LIDWKQYQVWAVEAFIGGRFASFMTVLCIVLLASSAAHFTWMVVPLPAEQAAPPVPVAPFAAPSHADALTLGREVVARHLFGQAQSAASSQSAAAIPETQLKLVLRGVMASTDPKTATAIVADPSGKEDFYTVGKELPGGAILKEVHAQYIVLSRGGRFETLRLPENVLMSSSSPVASPADAQPIAVAPEAGQLLQQYRDQFMQNPQSLANLLQGEPYWENGRLVGYRLRPGRDAGVLAKFGIQSGDVVTAINGVSLVDPNGRMELLRTINNATQFNVDLLRNGQPYSIDVPLGQPGTT
jgi:general secretion pathway protein C